MSNLVEKAMGGIAGKITDFALTNIQNHRNAQMNYGYNEMAATNAMNRKAKLIESYETPKAQIEMLKKAGMSPAVILGMQGTSGGISTGQAPQGGMNQQLANESQGLLNNALIAAQIENIKADTNEKEANTKDILETLPFKIDEIQAETDNYKAETDFKEAQTAFQELENFLKTQTLDADINKAVSESNFWKHKATETYWAAQREEIKYNIDVATEQKMVEKVFAEVEKIYSETKLNKEKAKEAAERAKVIYKEYELEVEKLTFERNKLTRQIALGDRQIEAKRQLKEIDKQMHEQSLKLQNRLAIMHEEFGMYKEIMSDGTQIISSLLHGAGMYMAGGHAQKLRNMNQNQFNDWQEERRRNLILYGSEDGTDPELLR